jgi:hypothetical protein
MTEKIDVKMNFAFNEDDDDEEEENEPIIEN